MAHVLFCLADAADESLGMASLIFADKDETVLLSLVLTTVEALLSDTFAADHMYYVPIRWQWVL